MTRTTTNAMLLDMIEDVLQGGSPQNEEPEAESAEEPEEDLRTTRNDDTNEPAIQRERRSARMVRRRDR